MDHKQPLVKWILVTLREAAWAPLSIIFWEFYENLLGLFFGTHVVRGLEDTIIDMFLGLMGALVFTLLYRKTEII